ncbi:MAG: hypothetical protein K9N38_05005 [Candidatus Marinimicrobia bacterium]|nr:hypothetical protein [Candidatus Neomarinimicrobiota bacterium]MCF7851016.1 hypothetical protein [Candidatus Neomarinimicrobiota bacterium]
MKIDLRKDRGILEAQIFSGTGVSDSAPETTSDDELIIETLKRRHGDSGTDGKTETEKAVKKQAKKERNAIPILLIILILTVAGGGYMLNTIGVLKPGLNVIENYWRDVLGLPLVHEPEYIEDADILPLETLEESLMTEDQFNELMPLTDELAALADSLAAIPEDSLAVDSYLDTQAVSPVKARSDAITTPAQNLRPLSEDDMIILNNRSLMLLVTEIVQNYPDDMLDGHLYIKRDALNLSAPRGGAWVDSLQTIMDKFVLGSFKADYSSGKVQISSKFSLIMAREPNFQANVLDGIRMLDVLANPFSDYLEEIVIDLSKGVDNNPATFTFKGSSQEMQYILSAWTESRTNLLLRSIDIKFRGENSILTFDVIFFDYRP